MIPWGTYLEGTGLPVNVLTCYCILDWLAIFWAFLPPPTPFVATQTIFGPRRPSTRVVTAKKPDGKEKENPKKEKRKRTSTTHCRLHDDGPGKTACNKGSQSGPLTDRFTNDDGSSWWVIPGVNTRVSGEKAACSPPPERFSVAGTKVPYHGEVRGGDVIRIS